MEVGLGLMIEPNETYGPVVEQALLLEKCAEYPRILVGDGLWQYLSVVAAETNRSLAGKVARALAQKCW